MMDFPNPTVEQFFQTYAISNFTVSENEEKLLFSTNLNGKMNIWAMDFPNQFPYLFAQIDESCHFLEFDPKNRFVLASFDRDGDENYHIYALPYEGGIPQKLISGEAEDKYNFIHLSEDGERLYYITSKDNPSFWNSHVRDLTTGEDKVIYQGENIATFLTAVSPNEQMFVIIRLYLNTYKIGHVLIDGKEYCLTPDSEKHHLVSFPTFIDDETIYFITDYDEEFSYLAKFDIKTKNFEKVISIEQESLTSLRWNKEEKTLYFTTEKGVKDYLYSYDLTSRELSEIDSPVDVIYKVHVAKSGTIYLMGSSAISPNNIYRLKTKGDWEQLTKNNVLGVGGDQMVEPEVVTYQSFDGMEIEALLFKAKPEFDNGHTIFFPHGGPQSAERKFYRSLFQVLLNRGYTIFAPNFRGSTGYGTSFEKLVERDWGHGPRLDCVEGIKWLFEQGISSPEKLFLVGGSYGGYMALLLHGRHSEYFKAVVDIFGPSDLFTFVKSVPSHWKPMMDLWVGDPERDKERFIKDSPITYLENMTKPMLVIQGAKDPRVVKEESDQIVAKLEGLGREVEYLVLEDEGHGFSKKENEIKVYRLILDFLEKYQS